MTEEEFVKRCQNLIMNLNDVLGIERSPQVWASCMISTVIHFVKLSKDSDGSLEEFIRILRQDYQKDKEKIDEG